MEYRYAINVTSRDVFERHRKTINYHFFIVVIRTNFD
jgi:hypothetical protein